MKTGVYANTEKTKNDDSAREFAAFLQKSGFSCDLVTSCEPSSLHNVDILFILGGDGTILRCAEACARTDTKIVGVNYGTLGFLAEFEKEERDAIPAFLQSAERGELHTIERSFLKTVCNGKAFHSLNEVALRRDYSVSDGRMLTAGVKVNGCEFDELSGDGVLVCTPTGSTAYSLSAGGPIIPPQTEATLFTPLCAFSLSARPVVFAKDDVIEISLLRGGAFLLVDGVVRAKVSEGEKIKTEKSELKAIFPTRSPNSFYKKARKKLG